MKETNSAASALAPVFQAVEKLTKPQRIGIYAGTLVFIIVLSTWFLFMPHHKNITGLEKRLVTVKEKLDKAKKNARELNYWRSQMKEKQAKYKKVMQQLPEKEEIPSLLAGISQAGKDAGLDFILFEPKPEASKGFYAEIPVNINVSGDYHQVAVFFEKVSNLPRIVNIRNVTIKPKKQKSGMTKLATTCQAVTYKFIDSAANSKKKKGAGRK